MTVSTHVLDASAGAGRGWRSRCRFVTLPAGGRPLSRAKPTGTAGTGSGHPPDRGYWLVFGTGAYFEARAVAAFYPEVVITFTSRLGRALSRAAAAVPFAYSTYRGS